VGKAFQVEVTIEIQNPREDSNLTEHSIIERIKEYLGKSIPSD
jgi:hypothetical protein